MPELGGRDEKREVLDRLGVYVSTPAGTSMRPMLRGERDNIRVEKCEGRLRRLDVALYCRRDGKHVLHRVVRVLENGYFMRGDNCDYTERNITDDMIIGKLVGFWRGDRYIPVEKRSYRLYAHWRNFCYPFRFLRIRLTKLARKTLSKSRFLRFVWRKMRGR